MVEDSTMRGADLSYIGKKHFIKYGLTALIILIMLVIPMSAGASAAVSAPKIDAKACIVVDADTGEVLYEKNADDVLVPASMTKLMTIYLTLEKINNQKISWENSVIIGEYPNKVSRQSSLSSYQLPLGMYFTVHELFYGAVINSSNASAIALAGYIGQDETGFIEMMNDKAKNFGLTDTRFVNSSGLNNIDLMGFHPRGTAKNEDTKISARSMATVAYRLINDYPEIIDYSSMTQKTIREGQPDQIVIKTTNKLLPTKEYALNGAMGLKTGYIFNAGYCFAGYTERPEGRLISIVMGATTSDERFKGSARLLEYGYTVLKERAESGGDLTTGSDLGEGLDPVKTLYPDKLSFYTAKNPVKFILWTICLVKYDKSPESGCKRVGIGVQWVSCRRHCLLWRREWVRGSAESSKLNLLARTKNY